MKRTDIRKIFTGRKKALAGCLAAVIVLAGGFNVWQSSQVPDFPDFTDTAKNPNLQVSTEAMQRRTVQNILQNQCLSM